MSLYFRSLETAEQEDALEYEMGQELRAAEEKYKAQCFELEVRYQFGFWNLVDGFGRPREDVTSQKSWDRVYATRHHFDPEGFPMNDEWDDVHDGDYCYDCGSPMCGGDCFWPDEPLDLGSRGDSEDDFEESSNGEDGCMDCGRLEKYCKCFDEDYVMTTAEEVEMMLAGIDFEAGDRICVRYTLRGGWDGGKKRAVLARANGHHKRNDDWKRSNRSAHKQWARHPKRLNSVLHDLQGRRVYEFEGSENYGESRDVEMRKRQIIDHEMERLHGRGGNRAECFRVFELPRLLEAA